MNIQRISRYLTYVLRHCPDALHITLDDQGYADVKSLLYKMNAYKSANINFEILKKIVETDEKNRYSFNENFTKIRANQGHSVEVDLGLNVVEPPEILYHGTATRFIDSIFERGLLRGKRQYVHLSKDEATAIEVGKRHGKPVVLPIASGKMYDEYYNFYLSKNVVWLVDYVPVKFIGESKYI